MEIRYWMDSVLILLRVLDTCGIGMLRSLWRDCIEEMCVVLHAPTVMTISGWTFHLRVSISFIKSWYFSIFSKTVRGDINHYNR